MKFLRFYVSSIIIFFSLFNSVQADSQCDNLTVHILNANNYQLSIKSVNVGGSFFEGEFGFVGNIDGKLVWKYQSIRQVQGLPAGCQSQAALSGSSLILLRITTSNNSGQYSATLD